MFEPSSNCENPVAVTLWNLVIDTVGTDTQVFCKAGRQKLRWGEGKGGDGINSDLGNGLTDPAKVQRGW